MTNVNVLASLGFDEDDLELLEARSWRRRLGRVRNVSAVGYLFLSATSPVVPGPGTLLGLAPRIRLLHHVALWATLAYVHGCVW